MQGQLIDGGQPDPTQLGTFRVALDRDVGQRGGHDRHVLPAVVVVVPLAGDLDVVGDDPGLLGGFPRLIAAALQPSISVAGPRGAVLQQDLVVPGPGPHQHQPGRAVTAPVPVPQLAPGPPVPVAVHRVSLPHPRTTP